MYLRVAAAQLDTVVGDLAGNVGRIVAALGQAESAGARRSAPSRSWRSPATRPRTCCSSRASWPTTWPRWTRWPRPPATAWPWSGSSSRWVPPIRPPGPEQRRRGPATAGDRRPVWPTRRRCVPAAGYTASTASSCCPTTASSTSSAGSPRAGGRRPSTGWAVSWSGCRSARTSGRPGGPVAALGRAGAQVVVNLNASPYSRGRRAERLAMLVDRVAEAGCPIAYVNQVGGQDELVFDGASLVVGADGTLLAAGAQFARGPGGGRRGGTRAVGLARPGSGPWWSTSPVRRRAPGAGQPLSPRASRAAGRRGRGLRGAGARDPRLPGQERLRRGRDRAVGRDRLVTGGRGRRRRPRARARARGCPCRRATRAPGRAATPPRWPSASASTCARCRSSRRTARWPGCWRRCSDGPPAGLTDENLQSRLRGVLLMAVSNATGADRAHHRQQERDGHRLLHPLRRLGRRVRGDQGRAQDPGLRALPLPQPTGPRRRAPPDPSPRPVLDKPPSAELRPDQRDDQSLPPYDLLDPVLEAYVERDRTAAELVADGFDPAVVDRVVRLVDGAEYKRRQMPPGVRITTKAFGKDRRMPITNHYRLRRTARRPGRPGRGWPTDRLTRRGPLLDLESAAPGRRLPLDRAAAVRADRGLGGRGRRRRRSSLHLDEVSGQHAWHAELWAARLPVLDGIDREALTRPGRSALPSRCSAPSAGAGDHRSSGWPASTGWCCPGCWSPTTGTSSGPPRWPTGRRSRALRLVRRDEVESWEAGEACSRGCWRDPGTRRRRRRSRHDWRRRWPGRGWASGLVPWPDETAGASD